jgi:hypothetical protein
MSQYYKPNRQLGLYENESAVGGGKAFRVSRSKIDLFIKCPRCFYLDRVLGIAQPPGYPFSLNSAVDKLLKKEFDLHRAQHTSHPLMKAYGLDAVPFEHPKMDEWRDSLRRGITFLDPETNLLITGGVDDVWVKPDGELIIVDYKATSKEAEVTLDAEWQDGYKRQMEVYQWLFRKNGFKVSDTGYFVYCNGKTDRVAFDGKLEFDIKLLPYTGKTDWIEGTIKDIFKCLNSKEIPKASPDCDYCNYVKAVGKVR